MSDIPDIAGKDLSPDPIAEAQRLASAIEAENTNRINKLLAHGLNPLSLQISAIQVRLEELLDVIPMPPLLRAQFEVAYEAAMAKLLDEAERAVTQPKLHVP